MTSAALTWTHSSKNVETERKLTELPPPAPLLPTGVDPMSSVSTEHSSAQRRSSWSGPGLDLLPGSEGPAELLPDVLELRPQAGGAGSR